MRRTGNSLPRMGNNLPSMSRTHKKLQAAEALAENLSALMSADANLSTGPRVAKASGVSRKSINNISENRHDPKLSSVEAIAKAFGLEAYQLLVPGLDHELLAIFRAYSETDESGKYLLKAAAETVSKARERRNSKTGTDE